MGIYIGYNGADFSLFSFPGIVKISQELGNHVNSQDFPGIVESQE